MNALILVDIQNDFLPLPTSQLPVPDGDAVIPVANAAMASGHYGLILATQDWHPADHGSFASRHPGRRPGETIELAGVPQMLWPDHCVQNTGGALFAAGLDTHRIERVFPKGTDSAIDSYSGFFDNGHRKATGLADYLRARGVSRLTVMGLAMDYCVKWTALDAIATGFETHLLLPGTRGVERMPGDGDRALDQMRQAGVIVTG